MTQLSPLLVAEEAAARRRPQTAIWRTKLFDAAAAEGDALWSGGPEPEPLPSFRIIMFITAALSLSLSLALLLRSQIALPSYFAQADLSSSESAPIEGGREGGCIAIATMSCAHEREWRQFDECPAARRGMAGLPGKLVIGNKKPLSKIAPLSFGG